MQEARIAIVLWGQSMDLNVFKEGRLTYDMSVWKSEQCICGLFVSTWDRSNGFEENT